MDFDAQLTINKKKDNLFLRKQEVILYTLCLNYPLLQFVYYLLICLRVLCVVVLNESPIIVLAF